MQKNLKTLLKIIILAIIIISLYRIWNFFINANNNSKIENTNISKENNSNSLNYKKFSSSEISKTWVAITTNLWIKYKQKEIKKLIKNFSPLQSFTVLFLNRSVRKSLLSHMIFPLLYNKHLKLYRDWYRIDFTFNIF